jgi:bifunctional DNA-binding transcriptional regulator/antitoxin component of YhaV-PrlF toxin-antitoxin module
MAKVTSKLQVTIPKALADRYGIAPGAEIEWLPAGDAIRVVPHAEQRGGVDRSRRLRLFDQATQRQLRRESGARAKSPAAGRGWTREELYRRGGAG